jgi:hypothetical protein
VETTPFASVGRWAGQPMGRIAAVVVVLIVATGSAICLVAGQHPPGAPWSVLSLTLLALVSWLRKPSESAWIAVPVCGAAVLAAGLWLTSVVVWVSET